MIPVLCIFSTFLIQKKNFLEKSEKKEKGKEDRISFSTHRYLFFLSESIYDNNHLSFSSSPTFQV